MMVLVVVVAAFSLLLQLPYSGAAFTAGSPVANNRQPGIFTCRRGPLHVVADPGTVSNDESRDENTPPANNVYGLGLLRGVDMTVGNFYANKIDMSREGLAWLDQPGLMWEAAIKDAAEKKIPVEEYIQQVASNFRTFRKSGFIYDRQELLGELNKIFMADGAFALLLGGKNVRKSTILKNLCKVANNKPSNVDASLSRVGRLKCALTKKIRHLAAGVFSLIGRKNHATSMVFNTTNDFVSSELLALYVDGRLCPGSLNDGLANGIVQLAAEILFRTPSKINWVRIFQGLSPLGRDAAIESIVAKLKTNNINERLIGESLKFLSDYLLDPKPEYNAKVSRTLVDQFIDIAKFLKRFPVLVIDEANEVLAFQNSNGKPDSQTRALLINLVSYTKQNHAMNVILTSSEHAYPFRLEREGFDLQNIGNLIFAGEIPPKEMRQL